MGTYSPVFEKNQKMQRQNSNFHFALMRFFVLRDVATGRRLTMVVYDITSS
jgi:hypothetical protein